MFCRNCGQPMTDLSQVCTNCGVATGVGNRFCQNCGAPTDPASVVCPSCGAALAAPVLAAEKSRIAAGLLGIFLGYLGVHRFYLGFVGIGIIQIIVTIVTCGVGGLWGFVEGILYLTGTLNRDAQGRPLRD